jgi:hypothetical protein
MGVLDRYARKPVDEKRTKSAGTRLEPSLYESFVEHCEKRGLTTSEAIRYLIVEAIAETKVQEHQNDNDDKSRLTKVDESLTYRNDVLTSSSVKLPGGNLLLKESSSASNNHGKAGSMVPWMVNNQIPCPICKVWGSRQNFKRDHAAKHGFSNGYDLIQAHLEEANRMVTEREQVRNEE